MFDSHTGLIETEWRELISEIQNMCIYYFVQYIFIYFFFLTESTISTNSADIVVALCVFFLLFLFQSQLNICI